MKFVIADFEMIANDPDSIHHAAQAPSSNENLSFEFGTVCDSAQDMLELEDVTFLLGGGAVWKNYWIHGRSIHYFPVGWAEASWRPGDTDPSHTTIEIPPENVVPDKTIAEPVMFCDTNVACVNFGHFIQEFLPYGWLFRKLRTKNPAVAPLIQPMQWHNQFQLMEIVFGLGKEAFLTRGMVTLAKRVFLPRRQTLFQGESWRTSFAGLRMVRETALAALGVPAPGHISYVVRPNKVLLHRAQDVAALRAAGNLMGRDFSNIPALVEGLANRGYIVLEPSKVPLESTARLLASAESVVGIHGANMANIVFCPRGTKVTEIRPATGVWGNWPAVAAVLGLEFDGIVQPPAPQGNPAAIDVAGLIARL